MRKRLLISLALGFFMGGIATSASAISLDIALIDGDWNNPVPTSGIAINNSGPTGGLSTARWGIPMTAGGPSGYDFQTSLTPLTVQTDGTAFVLGQFTHVNYTVSLGSNSPVLDSIELDINLGNIFNLSTSFSIDHNETPNTGGSSSNDIVTILNPVVNQQFDYMNASYYFNLFGFSQDGGSTLSTVFSTVEGQLNTANLYARITEAPVDPVPEPATMLLFGTGLAGIAGFNIRRKKKA